MQHEACIQLSWGEWDRKAGCILQNFHRWKIPTGQGSTVEDTPTWNIQVQGKGNHLNILISHINTWLSHMIFGLVYSWYKGFANGAEVKNPLQCRSHRRCGFNPWVGKVPWRRKWQPTPVFLLGESHEQRSLMGYKSVQFSSVTQLCPTLWDLMDRSTPGLPVHHQLLEFTQTHVHWTDDAIQPSHPLSSPSPPAFNLSQYQGLFKWVSSSYQVTKVLEFQLQHQSFQWTIRTDFL